MTDIDQKALEAALVAANDAANDDDTDHKAIMEAAILAYLANAPISEEMVERGAKRLMIESGCGQMNGNERVWCDHCDCKETTRAVLTAARKAGMGE